MRYLWASLLIIVLAIIAHDSESFQGSPAFPTNPATCMRCGTVTPTSTSKHPYSPISTCIPTSTALFTTLFSGEPTERARISINHRQVIRKLPLTSIYGEPVLFDNLIGPPSTLQPSIVVFLRSLG